MPKYSNTSVARLATAHPKLQEIFNEAIKIVDITILEGHRGEESQNKAFAEGKSKLRYPDSKHNAFPSQAVDFAPFPIDWNDSERFYHAIGIIKGIAHMKGIAIRSGGDWDKDGDIRDNKFNDLPHIELV